jgi:hypothetical protein
VRNLAFTVLKRKKQRGETKGKHARVRGGQRLKETDREEVTDSGDGREETEGRHMGGVLEGDRQRGTYIGKEIEGN